MRAIAVIMVWGLFLVPVNLYAAMSSTNYSIYADSINTGGIFSTSGAYSLQSTLGETPVGIATSSDYEIRGGYQSMESGYLTFGLSTSSLSLGNLSVSTVSAASTTATVSTDSGTGYILSIGSANWTSELALENINTVAFVTGTEAYGMTTSTVGGVDGNAFAVVMSQVVNSASAPIMNGQTVLTFKATRSASTVAGPRAQAVVFQAAANY